MAKIEVKGLTKAYQGLPVLDPLDFSINKGEFITILGPSGCGKSTMLNIMAGLISPDRGEVYIDGQAVTNSPGKVSFMHQKDLLLPWRTVLDNLCIPFLLKKIPRSHAVERIRRELPLFGLEGFESFYPAQLSGGMCQRAALLRTYLYREDLMFLDEPFGALDAITRERLHDWLLGILEKVKTTILMVTHDIDEAILLSNRILVFSPRPARILSEVDVTIKHSKVVETLGEPEFINLKRRILEILDTPRKTS
jgi:ABC-type nitrate/sulfonate/bicarbonate transport system ATPase subunit